jgi:hypothetical protein
MPRKEKINTAELKRDLINDLDQFLFEEKTDNIQVKKAALSELDKLIKQDLSYNQVLSSIKSVAKIEAVEQAKQSEHILDLRQVSRPSKKQKKIFTSLEKPKTFWQKLADNKKQKNQDKNQDIEYYYPESKAKANISFSINWQRLKLNHVASRLISFALVIAIILLPIRGLVFLKNINTDKDKIWHFGQQGLIDLQAGVLSASTNSYNEAQADFDQALLNFQQAQGVLDEYHQWMLDITSMMPVVGKPLSLSRNMLAVATNISEAATILNQNLQDQDNLTENLFVINQQISQTIPYLEDAETDLNNISSNLLPNNLGENLDRLKLYLPSTVSNLKNLNEIFSVLLEVLGHDKEKRYLILFQNNNELRATGGFIGSYALFDIYQGEVIDLEIPGGGTYDLEDGQTVKYRAPQALSLVNQYFNIWDANWWPDFPTSAQKISNMFQNSGGASVDGVIAINAKVLQDLLKVLGSVYLEEYEITITADNVFAVIQEEVEINYNKEINQPKAVIGDLVPLVLDKLLSFEDKQKEIINTFAANLASKDIQLYLDDKNLQSKIDDFGWSGSMINNDKDFLAVINTNIAGGKTDNEIQQTIDHQAEIRANGEIINTVRITRINNGSADNLLSGIDGGNVSYLRVYTPLGSEFIEAIGFDIIPENYFRTTDYTAQLDETLAYEETKLIDGTSQTEIYTSLDKTVFANWVALKPGESQTVSIKYKLPFKLDLGNKLVNNWWQELYKKDLSLANYSLLVNSQSGIHGTVFNSSVLLPNNIKIVWNTASDQSKMSITDYLITYSNQLERDQYFGFIIAAK